MRLLKGPPTGPRLLGLHKPLTIFGLIILLLLYWHFALLLENLNYIPRFFEALINIFRFFDPLFNIPIFFLERIAPYFSLRVLRHLIPPVAGWFMARQAILVFAHGHAEQAPYVDDRAALAGMPNRPGARCCA